MYLCFQMNQYFHYFLMSRWNLMTPYFQMNQNFRLNREVP
jgi:hypothetical protein